MADFLQVTSFDPLLIDNTNKGDPGDPGAPGATPNLQIGTITTGPSGTPASASITGTAANPILNMTIPTGPAGPQGPSGSSSGVVQSVGATDATITVGGTSTNPTLSVTGGTFDAAGAAAAAQAASLQKTSNLSDLGSASTARTNLGLGGAAVLNVGTVTGTVAAGDDSRITGAVQSTRQVLAGTGLTGGGALSADRTISMPNVGTAGTYGDGTHSLTITTDAQGRVTAVSTNAISSGSSVNPLTISFLLMGA